MTTPPPRWPARLAGLVAAAVALGVAEIATGVAGAPSLVASVGEEVVDRLSGGVVKAAIETFGTNDKAVLLTTIVVVCLALGGLVGGAAVRRRWIGPAAFGAAALVGAAAGIADPSASGGAAVVAAVLAFLAGWSTLALLFGVLTSGGPLPVATRRPVGGPTRAIEAPGAGTAGRRAFLAWSGAAAGFAGVAALGGRSLSGRPSTTDAARSAVSLPPVSLPPPAAGAAGAPTTAPAGLDVDGLSPFVTPNDRFYRIDTALVVPRVDPASWRLDVKGVPRPYSLTFDELLALPMIEAPVTIACVSNEVGGDLVGTARWQGVPLTTLLERGGVAPGAVPDGADQLVGRSVDGFTVGFPTEAAVDGRVAMVAVGMNGEPLPVNHGFPARLIVAGLYGYVSATKWLRTIELTGWDDFDAYWIPRGWSKEGPVRTQSRIDVPRQGADVRAGTVAVAGVAWAPTRGIAKVEVQVDDGPWQEARLGPGWGDDVWRQWVLEWDAAPGDHVLRVRATDATGQTQPEQRRPVAPDGATGWHSRRVRVA